MDKKSELRESARRASEKAYAPYSGFKVGSAVLMNSGAIYEGCNIENASYGLTMCAERIALFNAISAGEREPQQIAIYTATDFPFYPCGACRQVLAEFNPDLLIYVFWKNGEEELRLSDLLTKQFTIKERNKL